MVASWLPDPPLGRSRDEISTISVPTVFVDSDSDDQELNVGDENVLENGGYSLLNDHDNHLDENHEESEVIILCFCMMTLWLRGVFSKFYLSIFINFEIFADQFFGQWASITSFDMPTNLVSATNLVISRDWWIKIPPLIFINFDILVPSYKSFSSFDW